MSNYQTNRPSRSGTCRRLQLNKQDGWLAGVCAGVATYVGTDPAFVRVAALVSGLFLPKVVIAAYLIAWLILDDRNA